MDKQSTFYTHIQHSPSEVHQNNNRPQEIFEKETKKVYSYLQSQKHTFVYVSIERKKKLLDDYYTYLLEHIHFLSSSFSSASYLFIDEMGHMSCSLISPHWRVGHLRLACDPTRSLITDSRPSEVSRMITDPDRVI